MRIIQVNDQTTMAKKATAILAAQVLLKPGCVLGLATGSTPEGAYAQLVSMCKNGEISFKKVKSVNLDEYVGLAPSSPQSYRFFMNEHLFNGIDIDKSNTHVPDGLAKDLQKECARYDALIASLGGIDLQLLGIGLNGHIGFNEPGESFVMDTQCVELTASTIAANAVNFESAEAMPRRALTLGMRGIMQSKRILLMAGANKKDILHTALYGPVTPHVPASLLQLHPDVTIISCEV